VNQVDLMDDKEKLNNIIPPLLYIIVRLFYDHYKISGNSPLMIIGGTGVGKSMFLRLFEKLYEKDQPNGQKKRPIIWANCAHFGGENSDPNIARSELFGHIKNAFYGATGLKLGLVTKAEGGVLILEEIGELPKEVQAMLLTFIETGEYRMVGDNEPKKANVRIVGATNSEETLREDFRHRFFPFYVQDIYLRRGDILYYLFAKFPDLVRSLNAYEVLVLLAYNWPGNCREIERVARIIFRNHHFFSHFHPELDELADIREERLAWLSKPYTNLDVILAEKLLDKIRTAGGDTELLATLLSRLNVSLQRDKIPIFSNLPDHDIYINSSFRKFEDDPNYDLYESKFFTPLDYIEQFDKAYVGYIAFCELFGQFCMANKNIFENIESAEIQLFRTKYLIVEENEKPLLKPLIRSIMSAIKGVKWSGDTWPDSLREYWVSLEKIKNQDGEVNKNDPAVIKDERRQNQLNFDMTEDDLLNAYYRNLLSEYHGNVDLAAQKAGLKENTLRSRLVKRDIKFGRKFNTKKI
jgi:DNA-binding NtrC family response regulator